MNTPNPFEQNEKRLPSLLNVITILTLVWSGFEILTSIWNFSQGRKGIEKLEELQGSEALEKMPAWAQKLSGPDALERARTMYENRIPIFVITLVGVGLCIYGALQMRKLQKNGYYMWLIGEILPIIGMIIFVGFGFAGPMSIMLVFPLLFIILYTTQLKYLK